jgi:hypothetical protein
MRTKILPDHTTTTYQLKELFYLLTQLKQSAWKSNILGNQPILLPSKHQQNNSLMLNPTYINHVETNLMTWELCQDNFKQLSANKNKNTLCHQCKPFDGRTFRNISFSLEFSQSFETLYSKSDTWMNIKINQDTIYYDHYQDFCSWYGPCMCLIIPREVNIVNFYMSTKQTEIEEEEKLVSISSSAEVNYD